MNPILDHVTLGASSLEAGAAHLREVLGVDMPPGGRHPDMSTHNRVLNVGGERFLELIATDPDAPAVARKRWFGLDDPRVAARLAARPRGVGWVVRTEGLERVAAASPVGLGRITRMSRGERSWRLTVRDDGMTPFDGLVPGFIEWSPGPHPSQGMQFLGPELIGIELRHPDAAELARVLDRLGVGGLAGVEPSHDPSIAFVFRLADGRLQTVGH